MMRYAVYFAPDPASALWRFGSAVLGYDAATGLDIAAMRPDGFAAAAWQAATADPRRYGFHATLKAPFALIADRAEEDVIEAMASMAATMPPVELSTCAVSVIPSEAGGGFVAITPTAPPPSLSDLERAVVTGFDRFRASLSDSDRARRRPDQLTERQRAYLDRLGYPYVLEEFRFHMTLTGRLDEPAPVAVALAALASSAGIGARILVDRLCLFRQDAPNQRFRIVASHPLLGSSATQS